VHQTFDTPQLNVNVDRSQAQRLGLTQQSVASNVLVTLSGSFQTTPSFWIDPRSGNSYSVSTQAPQYRVNSLNDIKSVPITNGAGGPQQLLGNLATLDRASAPAVVSHYNSGIVLDIYVSIQGADLGYVANAVDRAVAATKGSLPKGSSVAVRGQAETMRSSFAGLLLGLVGAIMLVYLLIVINFQSWLDPLIIITALPAALAGIVWMMFVTHTTVSVPVLTGAIMCMGLATANSILVVSFARERMHAGSSAYEAAMEAGFTRLRPVIMTALAMIIGMLPMALGLGEGGEQNAPLGRAVIGGLLFATVATLFLVPAVFSLIHGRKSERSVDPRNLSSGISRVPLLVLLVVLVLAALGIYARISAHTALGAEAHAAAVPVVRVVTPAVSTTGDELVLPASLQAFSDAPVYARTSGYLQRWLVDIGTPVKKGQLLAEIDTPEVDQQLRQAEADRATAEAASKLATTTADRWTDLLKSGTVAKQDVDDKVGDAEAKAAALRSAEANVARLHDLESFKRIVAPFDGVITARHTDVGALVNAGSGTAAGAELFHIASSARLRAYVSVPQDNAPQISKGQEATVVVTGAKSHSYRGVVASTAQAIDTSTGTLLVQLEIDNKNGELLPGAYAEVHFKLPQQVSVLRVPANALQFRSDGMAVVTVNRDNRFAIQRVGLGRDFGTEVEIISGVTDKDRVVVNPPESAVNGQQVMIATN
jgi:RND family efflux transporter MFP subunit